MHKSKQRDWLQWPPNKVGMGLYAWYLRIKSILLNYHDKILQPPLCLSVHIMEGKLKILGTNP